VFYDADCPGCRQGVARFGAPFARRGFLWRPLQTPGAAAHLGITDAARREEMTLLLADGRILGGLDAWCALFRSVWWLWPLGALLALPGARALAAAAYRRIARHRYCIGGRRREPDRGKGPRRHRAFFEMP
jgi:predicted DCC family thiol-disulfide oxidoreductase YuxK